jgi:hypothetical protein
LCVSRSLRIPPGLSVDRSSTLSSCSFWQYQWV